MEANKFLGWLSTVIFSLYCFVSLNAALSGQFNQWFSVLFDLVFIFIGIRMLRQAYFKK